MSLSLWTFICLRISTKGSDRRVISKRPEPTNFSGTVLPTTDTCGRLVPLGILEYIDCTSRGQLRPSRACRNNSPAVAGSDWLFIRKLPVTTKLPATRRIPMSLRALPTAIASSHTNSGSPPPLTTKSPCNTPFLICPVPRNRVSN